ncbi:MAG: methyltransferase domain-containing protein [Planctomycetota bacterium]
MCDTHDTADAPAQPLADDQAFDEWLLDSLNRGALALMISIGHRTGLFDRMADGAARTSTELARDAGLSERYVREWLGAMVAGRIVLCDDAASNLELRFHLPGAHAAALTRAAGPDNIAVFAQYIGVLGHAESKVVEAFEHGNGVPYADYPRFHEVMAEDSGQSVLGSLIDHILPLDDDIVAKLSAGAEVCDVGCGRGLALMLMAEHFPESRFCGIDFSHEAIEFARSEARARGLINIDFEIHDAASWREFERYDLVFTFDSIHDQARPDLVLANIAESLKPDGIYLMQDIKMRSCIRLNTQHPMGPLLYTISCMHCMSVSLAYGGMGLGAAWGRELAETMLTEAGFTDVVINELGHDTQNDYYIIRKQPQTQTF